VERLSVSVSDNIIIISVSSSFVFPLPSAAYKENDGAAGLKGDQPEGWLSDIEGLSFSINRSVVK
jgi:hypothetical protein